MAGRSTNRFSTRSNQSALRCILSTACALLAAATSPTLGDCGPVKLIASDAAPGDNFGISVAIFGDTAVIGAYVDDHAGGVNAGAAYVFVHAGGMWTEQAKLTASDAAADDGFGIAVAVSGDTAVVGAWANDHTGGTDAGAAYVFVRAAGVWTQQAKLTASDAAANDQFGASVAVFGDTAVIGAYFGDAPGAANAGATYVFPAVICDTDGDGVPNANDNVRTRPATAKNMRILIAWAMTVTTA